MFKKLLMLITFGIILFIGFIAWFIYGIITDKPPHFFPLHDTQAQYTITKNCPHGQGSSEKNQSQGTAYCLEYKGNHVLLKDYQKDPNFFRITIGKSSIDLEKYLNKKVKNITGEFTSSDKQCVMDVCADIGGPFVVVDIDTLDLAE